eukprot:COSAG01_NODE_3094_length_6607_cov_2.703419_3_plen_99_part_00
MLLWRDDDPHHRWCDQRLCWASAVGCGDDDLARHHHRLSEASPVRAFLDYAVAVTVVSQAMARSRFRHYPEVLEAVQRDEESGQATDADTRAVEVHEA